MSHQVLLHPPSSSHYQLHTTAPSIRLLCRAKSLGTPHSEIPRLRARDDNYGESGKIDGRLVSVLDDGYTKTRKH